MARRRSNPETEIQRAVVQHLRARGADSLVFLHVPNGGKRRPIEAAIFKSMGVRAGAPDLLLWHRCHSYALELKAPGGRASEAQMQFMSDFNSAGGFGCIVEGLDCALKTLETWGLLKGVAA